MTIEQILPEIRKGVPDGIYDNQSAAYREWWKNGKLVKSEQAILHWKKKRRPWGSYPDRPRLTE